MKKIMLVILLIVSVGILINRNINKTDQMDEVMLTDMNESSQEELNSPTHPMAILNLREMDFPGSQIEIVEELDRGSNYSRYIASYKSEGNTIYGLLTLPDSQNEEDSFPIIAFVHGYIPPNVYKTTERYVAYQDNLARSGFITYKIDLRGHDKSEGEPVNGHYSEKYVIDTLNAISSMKTLDQANPDLIGIWGHSNGGEIGLRSMAVWPDQIDAGVFWAGVVGSFSDMLETYNKDISFLNLEQNNPKLVDDMGLPSENPDFWNSIDPFYYLSDIKGAIQLHHGTNDSSVPIELSQSLYRSMQENGVLGELYEYEGGDHNLGGNAFGPAMNRTIEFFNRYLSD